MTTAIAIAAFLFGAFACWAAYRVRRANDRISWILRGQAQAQLEHGWHPAVFEGCNTDFRLRRYSSDKQSHEPLVVRNAAPSASAGADESR